SLRGSASTGIAAAQPKISNYSNAKGRFTGACAVGLHAQSWPLGTEFLDAETGRQKSPPKCVNARRDQNPGCEWPEIPAETPYLASYRKRAVCGDWMVVCAVPCEPVSASQSLLFPVIRIFSGTRIPAFAVGGCFSA